MTIQETINFVDIARMNYICDPHECGFEKGKDPCTAFHCDEMHDALAMAVEALEKQIPKKARYKIVGNGWNDWAEGKCPACGVDTKNTPTYCPHCGQHIDWSDTE